MDKSRPVPKLLPLILIVFLGIVVYSNIYVNSFHFDDFPQIVNDPAIRNIGDLKAIWGILPSRFVTLYSFALNYHWGGLNVFGYHVVNLLIHIGSSALVCLLAFLMTDIMWLAFFAGAIFLVHPIQTEAVNYIWQRGTLLATFFFLSSLIFYIKARLTQKEEPSRMNWALYYAGALGCAILAMLSKEMAVSLPFIICLYEFYFLRDGQTGRWKIIVPLFLVALLIPWLTIHSLDFSKLPRLAQDNSGVPVGHYFLTQLRVKVTYLRLLFVPVHQSIAYDFSLAKSIFEVPILLSAILLTVVLGAGVMLKNKFPLMSFGILWFLITIFPESSFIPTNNAACEYRLYLPMVGFSLFLCGGAFQLFKYRNVKWAISLLFLLALVYSVLTYHRNKVWENEFTLWDDAVHKDPQSQRAHLNRGAAYQKQGDLGHALQDYNAVIGLGPPDFVTMSNRGAIFEQRGELDLALANFNAAVKIDPGYPGSYKNRGKAYFRKGDLVDALKDFNTYITMFPSDPDGYISRGAVYTNTGHLDQALSDFNKAASLQPGDSEIDNDRAIVLRERTRSL